MRYKYCPNCGTKLHDKKIGDEGLLPYCSQCEQPFWDTYSSSVICAVINEYNEIALLRQDYVSTINYVCVAGMIKVGETAEETAEREIKEELGLDVVKLKYINSYYYDKKDLLMLGYRADVIKKDFILSTEVDSVQWFPMNTALERLRVGGIAWQLVKTILEINKTNSNLNIGVRSTAKAIIINDNKILLNKCYDVNNGNYYSLPGGGQNKYENIYEAVIRECKEETGYDVTNIKFKGIFEEICDNDDTRTNYSQYAHKLYHIFSCNPTSLESSMPTEQDDMQESCQWISIDSLEEIRILPDVINKNIHRLIIDEKPVDLGSTHIPFNHG